MILALEVVADAGVIAIPFQAIMGAVFSLIVVGLAFVIGYALLVRVLNRIWYSSSIIALSIVLISFAILIFGRDLGFTATLQLSEGRSPYKALHPAAAYGGMLAAIFGALHFPRRQPTMPNKTEHADASPGVSF